MRLQTFAAYRQTIASNDVHDGIRRLRVTFTR